MFTFATIIVTILLSLLIWKYYKFYTTVYPIPAPGNHPFIGDLIPFLAQPDKLLKKIRIYCAQFYPIFRLSSGFFSVVALLDPKDIEQFLSNPKHLEKTRAYSYLSEWLGDGLLTSSGSKWQKRRKMLTPTFHFNILQQFVTVFNEETVKLVAKLQEECESVVDIMPLITNYTLQSIGETAMGFKGVNKQSQIEYKTAIGRFANILLNRISNPWYHIKLIYKLSSLAQEEKKVLKILHDFSNNIIFTRENEINRVEEISVKKRLAMLDLLLLIKHQTADIDYKGIREEVDTFMFEGHDTTSMALSFTLLCLSNHKDIQSKVFEEIIQIIGPDKMPTFHDLQELELTERCIKESLRLFPSVPFIGRRAGEDFKTATGYIVPKGTIIHIHIFDVHRNAILYPDPLKFDPDRFLPENNNSRPIFSFIPFSAGPRNCIGKKYAMLELKTALCGILRKFMLEPVDDYNAIDFVPDLVLRPKNGINIKVLPRTIKI